MIPMDDRWYQAYTIVAMKFKTPKDTWEHVEIDTPVKINKQQECMYYKHYLLKIEKTDYIVVS